jgi:hypothetical protein
VRGNERSFGTEFAGFRLQVAPDGAPLTSADGGLIRTLGVSLIAIAAIVASLTVARQRQDAAPAPEGEKRPQHSPTPSRLDLDQLRAAGM